MDAFVNEADYALLKQDRYTFAVLDRILRSECELILSDHVRLILCHSSGTYPVWIWTPDGISEAEKDAAWTLAQEVRPLGEGYRYNLKQELAEHFIKRAAKTGLNAGISMRLFAYDCPLPMEPAVHADGAAHCCTAEDVREVSELFPLFYAEIGEETPSPESCLEKAREYIGQNAFWLWKNADGKTVACCSYKCNQGLASLGSVFTLPDCRRRHYAQNLVYWVTKTVRDKGLIPMLYTDADYPASNACYEKIGYRLCGKLCMVAAQK